MNFKAAIICLIGLSLLNACRVHRDLRITEVGLTAVELYLDEPANNTLALADHKLLYKSSNGDTAQIDLSGSIDGGKFLVIWEESGYSGSPVRADYTNWAQTLVPGIKVEEGFFGAPQAGDTFAYRVFGTHGRGSVTDKVDDVVKFGPWDPEDAAIPPRPDMGGGAFVEDGSLSDKEREPGVGVVKARTISRRWRPEGPADNDHEYNWTEKNESFGSPTP